MQRRIQNPVKNLKWSVLQKQGIAEAYSFISFEDFDKNGD